LQGVLFFVLNSPNQKLKLIDCMKETSTQGYYRPDGTFDFEAYKAAKGFTQKPTSKPQQTKP